MSNIEPIQPDTSQPDGQDNSLKQLTKSLFESVEVMSLQKGKTSFDLNSLSPEQKDKVLDLMSKNEDNAYAYHTKKLASEEKIKIKQIEAFTLSQRTKRVLMLGCLVGLFAISIIIIFYKETYFVPWLTFITGLGGGYGLGTRSGNNLVSKDKKNSDDSEEDE